MSRKWFIADTHFGQERTRVLSRRPFRDTCDMDEIIMLNWRRKVKPDDVVYHLGDFGDPGAIEFVSGRQIFFLPGNHEGEETVRELKKDKRVTIISPNFPVEINGESDTSWGHEKMKNQIVHLIHQPVEGLMGREALYLFGHIHKFCMIKRNGLNVGVDCHNFCPINEDTVVFYLVAILRHYDQNVFSEYCGVEGTVG